jgi:catabolite regulation protein CreA
MPTERLTMKIVSIAAFVAVLGALGASASADISVIDNNKTLDVDCAKDPEVNLVGNHIKVTTRGVCAKIMISGNHATVTGSANLVLVSGNHNTVTLAAADDVMVSGNNNTLTVRKGATVKAPRIANSGNDNHVTPPR